MDHIILTRFNVRTEAVLRRPTDKWLRDRILLFENFCLPSVSRQTSRAFSWILFFDEDTPQWARQDIDRIILESGLRIHALYLKEIFTVDSVRAAVRPLLTCPILLTTRVDNDDCIADDFVETLQATARGEDRKLLINFDHGAQYVSGAVYSRPYRFNPFISLREDVSSGVFDTVFIRGHDQLSGYCDVRPVTTGHPMWLQIVHGANIANEVVGLRVRGQSVARHFPVEVSEVPFPKLIVDKASGVLRICWRLARRPSRVGHLLKVIAAAMSRTGAR